MGLGQDASLIFWFVKIFLLVRIEEYFSALEEKHNKFFTNGHICMESSTERSPNESLKITIYFSSCRSTLTTG